MRLCLLSGVALAAILCGTPGRQAALGNPVDPAVKAGQVTISENGPRLDVHQATDKAIIDWRGFSIAAGETTQFHQPSASSLTLNRVTGGDPSAILGTLRANGQIMLVNPNGVLFGPGSRIDVAGLVATTSNIRDDDFLSGNYDFSIPTPNPDAMVVNEGTITVAEAGYAALVAPRVRNSGTINARLGRVTLGAGQAFTLDLYGDNLVTFQLGVDEAPADAGALVENSGTIVADGGIVTLTSDQVGPVLRNVVNMDGMIQANSFASQGGRVVLGVTGQGTTRLAGNVEAEGGQVEIAGADVLIEDGADIAVADGIILITADADATLRDAILNARQITIAADADFSTTHDIENSGGDAIVENTAITARDPNFGIGGRVEITGDRIALLGTSVIDATGEAGGGEILIGGNYQGDGPERNATATAIGPDARIDASAGGNGDGGRVILWADDTTRFYGEITARGGRDGGDGGFAEVSGAEHLDFEGEADLSAPNGMVGTLLLDPRSITISNTHKNGDFAPNGPTEFQAKKNNSKLGKAKLLAALNTNNVLVKTKNGGHAGGGIIVVTVNIIGNANTRNLTLQSHKDIELRENIRIDFLQANSPGTITINAGRNLVMRNGSSLQAAGRITLNPATAITGPDSFTIRSRSGVVVNRNISAGGTLTIDGNVDGTGGDTLSFTAGRTVTAGTLNLTASNSQIVGAGALTLNAASGFTLGDNLTTAGATTINADSNNDGTGTFTLDAGATIDTNNSPLTIFADDMALNGSIDSGAARTSLRETNGGAIDLEGAGPDLNLSAAELDNITANVLQIGDGTAGAITVSGNIAPANSDTLHLVSGSTVTATAGAIAEANLAVTAGGAVTLDNAATDLDVLAVNAAGQSVTVGDTDAIAIGALDGVTGIGAAALTLSADDGIAVNEGIAATGATVLDADADNDGTGDFVIAASKSLDTAGATLSIAANDIDLQGTLDSAAAATTLLVSDGGTIGLGAAAGDYTITGAELGRITATGLTIGDAANGNVTVNGIAGTDSDQIAGTVTLNATANEADVTFSGAASTFNALTVNADDSIFVDQDISTVVGDLALVADFDAFDDAGLDRLQFGAGTVTLSTAGTFTLQATTGGITTAGTLGLNIDDGYALAADFALDGALIIDADADDDGTGTLTVNTGVDLSTGGNPLSIVADDIDIQGSGTISSGAAVTTVTRSTAGSIGLGAAAGGLQITGTELQQITAGGLTLGGANTTALTVDGISAANSAGVDTVILNATANEADVTFSGAASTFNALTVNADDSVVVNQDITTVVGDLSLVADFDDFDDLGLDRLQFGTGTVTLTTAGALTLQATTGGITAAGILGLDIDDGFTLGGDLTLAGALTIDADADDDGTGTFTVATGADLSTAGNPLSIIANDIDIQGTGTISSGPAATTITRSSAGSIGLGAAAGDLGITGGELQQITAGGLTLGGANTTALVVDGITAANSAGVDTVTLKATANEADVTFSGAASSFDALTVNADDSIFVNQDIETVVGSLSLVADFDNFDDAGPDRLQFGAGTITLTTAGALTLQATTGGIDALGALSLLAANGLTLGDLTLAGTTTLNADNDGDGTGTYTQSAGTTFSSSNNPLTIVAGDIDLQGSITSGTARTTLLATNGGTIDLGGTAGDLDLSAAELDNITASVLEVGEATGGAITVSGNIAPANTDTLHLVTGGTVTATAGAIAETNLAVTAGGAVTLDNAATDLDVLAVSAPGQGVTVRDVDAIAIGAVDVVTGITADTLSLTAGGAITDNAASTVAGATTLDAGAATNDITLDAANDFATVAVAQARNVTLTDSNAIDLGASTIAGTLNVTANGAISDSAVLTVAGTATLDAGAATNDITLDEANDFATVAVAQARNVELADVNAIDLGASTVSGTFDVTADGAISDSGALAVAGTAALDAGAVTNDITLDEANNFATVAVAQARNVALTDINAIDLGASIVSGTLNVTANGAVTDSGALTVAGTATLNAGAGNDISLDEANDFATVAVAQARNVELTDVNAIDLGASTVSGTFDVTADGAISDSGALTVAGTTTLDAGAATNDIALDEANDFATVAVAQARNVALTDSNAIDLGASTVSGALDVTADGAISDSGALDIAGTATLDAGAVTNDITLDEANNFATVAVAQARNVAVTDSNAIDLGASTIAGTLDVTANGAISDSGVLDITGTATLDAGAVTNDIALDEANDFATVAVARARNVALTDVNAIDLGASSISGSLDVTANGAITDSAALSVAGLATLAAGPANDITLNSAANDFAAVAVAQARNVVLVDATALALNATAIGGALDADAADGLTIAGNVTTNSTTAGPNKFDADSDGIGPGDFTVAAGATLNSGGNLLTVTAGDLILNGNLNSGAASTTLLVSDGGTIGLGAAAGDYSIDGAELGRIAATGLTIGDGTTGAVTVDGVTATNSNAVAGLLAINGGSGIAFSGGASTFNALAANADDGIAVSAALTTDIGPLVLEGDANNGTDGADTIALTADLTSAGAITLDATSGGIVLGASQVITAGGAVSVNDALSGPDVGLTVNAGGANVTFAGLDLGAAAGTLSVTGGTVDTGNQLIADSASLDGAVVGSGVAVRQLTLTGASAGMSGTIDGVSGEAAALLAIMPDAPSHLFNGCQVSGCAAPPGPGGKGGPGGSGSSLSAGLGQNLNAVYGVTVEDGPEENEGATQDFRVRWQDRSGDQARLADRSRQGKLERIRKAMESQRRRGNKDQAIKGREEETDCIAGATGGSQEADSGCGSSAY